MTEDEGHGFRRIMQDRSRGLSWADNHDNRQPQMARRAEFGEGRLAAAVLGHENVDRFLAQELFLRFNREGAAPKDYAMARQVRRKRERLNRANKIEMLLRCPEGPDLQAADRQKNALRFTPERGGGSSHIGGIDPIVPRLWNPRRARQNNKRNFRPRGRDRRMARHLFGEGMRGVYEHIYSLGFEIGFKSVRAAKTAGPIGNFWCVERLGAAGEGQHGRNAALPRKEVRELARLRSPAKHENLHRSFPELLLSPP
jgi:hypothetical protein